MSITFTFDQIQSMACGKSTREPWGYKCYLKNERNEWYLDHLLIVDEQRRQSTKVYTDNRPSEIIKWGGAG